MRFPRVPLIAVAAFFSTGVLSVLAQGGKRAPVDPFATPDDQTPPGEPQPNEFLVRTEVFALPADAARTAMRQFPKQAELYFWLDTEMAKPTPVVKLERMEVLRMCNGQRAALHGIDEYPVAINYDPARSPQTIGIGSAAPSAAKGGPPPVVESKPAAAPGGAVLPSALPQPGPAGSLPASRVFPPWPYQSMTPTGIGYRNAGWSQELEIDVGEDGKAMLTGEPEFMKPAGWEAMMANGEMMQPVFERRRLKAHLTTALGQPAFAGTFDRPPNTGAGGAGKDEATRLLFYTVIPVPARSPDAAGSADPFEARADDKDGGQAAAPEGFLVTEAYSLPAGAARKALLAHPDEAELYQWLDKELAGEDSGVVLEYACTMRVRSGKRDRGGETVEFPWAGEISSAQIPLHVSLPANAASTPIPGTNRVFAPWPATPTTPSAIAVKYLGWALETETEFFGDAGRVSLNVAVEKTRLAGKMLFGARQDFGEPVFEVQKVTTRVETDTGRPALVSTFTPPTGTDIPGANTSERVWFLFMTVTGVE